MKKHNLLKKDKFFNMKNTNDSTIDEDKLFY